MVGWWWEGAGATSASPKFDLFYSIVAVVLFADSSAPDQTVYHIYYPKYWNITA